MRKETRPVSLCFTAITIHTLRNCRIIKKSTTTEPQQPKNRLSVNDKKTIRMKRSVFKAFLRTKLQGDESTELVYRVVNLPN